MPGETIPNRTVLAVSGSAREDFLQGLVTNDLVGLANGLIYAALLTPQGKYLSDFFLYAEADRILMDVAQDQAAGLLKRLSLYKLRSDVTLETTDVTVVRGLGAAPDGAWPDPRHPDLGWRGYGLPGGEEMIDWDALRVRLAVPEAGIELRPDDTFILEAGFERLNGVDFRKGCYVGQEVTARMKHKTTLRKGLAIVAIEGAAPVGTPLQIGEKTVGTLFTQSGGQALAHLRFDQAKTEMRAEDARVQLIQP